jgi:hypothetical protein
MVTNHTEHGRAVSFSASGTPSSFRSVRGLGLVIVAAATAVTGLRAVELVLTWQLSTRLQEWEADGYGGTEDSVQQWVAAVGAITWIAMCLQMLTGLLFIVWVYRARRNAELLCSARHRLPGVWAIVGFLPVVNWVIPPILVDDIQRASDPATPRNAMRLPPSSTTGYVVAWWFSFVLAATLYFLAYLLSIGVRRGLEDSAGSADAGLLVHCTGLILLTTAAGLLTVLLTRIGRWQAARAEHLAADPEPEPAAVSPAAAPSVPGVRPVPQLAPGGGLGLVAAVLSCTVVAGPALIAIASPHYQTVRDAPTGTAEYEAAMDAWAPLTLLGILAWGFTMTVAGVLFLCWLWRARINAEHLDPSAHTLRRGWTIGSWFLPLGNLVLPALVVGDVHRAGRTPVAGDAASTSYSPLVAFWWLSWLTTWIWTWLALLLQQPILWWATTAFFALTAALLVAVIRQIDAGQQAAADQPYPAWQAPTS